MGTTPAPVPVSEEVVTEGRPIGPRRFFGLLVGPAAFAAMLLLPAPGGMEEPAWRAAAVGVLMAVWWVTEAIPIPATALIPLTLFPVLGVQGIDASAAPYANPVIFLFMGGFFLAQAMQRWELHRRIALMVIVSVGTEPVRIVAGFMLAAGFLSMWVSNTATAVMMLPIGLSVVQLATDDDASPGAGVDRNFALAMMLGIAYACSIGGLATLIGTPPNALLVGYMAETFGVRIGFGQWMLLGVPLVAVGLPLSWLLLTRVVFPVRIDRIAGGAETIRLELRKLGSWTRGERVVAVVFAAAAIAWVARPALNRFVPELSDAGIAIIAALALFLVPVDPGRGTFALEWDQAKRIPWDVLILFGGGLSLAGAINATGLAAWIGERMTGFQTLPTMLLIAGVATVVIFLTELTSNTATAAAFLPILGSLAVGIGEDPLLLTIPAALAASCAFMLPVATPPNAIVYGSGYVSIPEMARGGVFLNALFVFLITLLGYAAAVLVFASTAGPAGP